MRKVHGERLLQGDIRDSASLHHCTYCGRRSRKKPISIPVEDLIDVIREGLVAEYNDAADEPVPYESAEGGYQLPTMTTHELLFEVGFYAGNDQLHDRIVDALPDYAWIRRNPLSLSEDEALSYGWEEFSRVVKHRVRYLLFPSAKEDDITDEICPAFMLDALGSVLNQLELFSELRVGTTLYRVRLHAPGIQYTTLQDLSPPPSSAARFSNRMSPAGISMIYAALDEDTAIAETRVRRRRKPMEASVGVFELTKDVKLLDLVHLPQIPSIFAGEEDRWRRPGLIFLHGFREDFTKPVIKDGREHVEYVPPQVVTEYLRYRFRDAAGLPVSGVLYPSARRRRGVGCVLFVSYEDCADDWTYGAPTPPPFRLVSAHTRSVP